MSQDAVNDQRKNTRAGVFSDNAGSPIVMHDGCSPGTQPAPPQLQLCELTMVLRPSCPRHADWGISVIDCVHRQDPSGI